jgi:hypothetical protein
VESPRSQCALKNKQRGFDGDALADLSVCRVVGIEWCLWLGPQLNTVTDVVRDPTRIKASGATCQLEAFADLQIAADLPQLLRIVPGVQQIGDGILVGAHVLAR